MPGESIPPPRDDDDDDVAWALQTAAVQWQRGSREDAVVWLRRAVDAAIQVGAASRVRELNVLAARLSERLREDSGSGGSVTSQVPAAPARLAEAEARAEEVPARPVAGARAPALSLSGEIPIVLEGEESSPTLEREVEEEGRPVLLEVTPGLASPERADGEAAEQLGTSEVDDDDDVPTVPPPAAGPALVDGISLAETTGFEDLPEEAQNDLARRARLEVLDVDEEVGAFAAALVTKGMVGIQPAIADLAGATASAGEVVFTRGTLAEGVALRVVAREAGTRVVVWDDAALEVAFASCPWVADELRLVADRFQALAGATLGPLGEGLDEMLRGMVMHRLEARAVEPGEVLVEDGKPVPGLHIVGAGRVELLYDHGREELGPGDILFAEEVMAAGMARATARAGPGGAVVLLAPRAVAHELMVSVPPLLEILSG